MASSGNCCGAFDVIIPSASTFVASSFGTKHMLYDVFINHCGQDTKHTLATNLYDSLKSRGLRAFLDKDELKLGDLLPKALEEAMASAPIFIAIFSEHYAESPWCLAELEFMVKSRKTIIPVFYHVDPCDLRWAVKGKRKYANAFYEHEEKERYAPDVLQRWKEALQEASCCIGGIIQNNNDEPRVVKDVVNRVMKGMENVFQSDGMGDSIKTTLVEKIFCKLCSAMMSLCRPTRKLGESGEEEDSYEELDKELAVALQTVRKFSYARIRAATHNFSENEIIARGGSGTVYRGNLCETQEVVAIKKMSHNSQYQTREYLSEVILTAKLSHQCIAKLLGWCQRKAENYFLVYEFLPNGSLDRYIFGNPNRGMDWDKRYRIACDVASALVYLHHDCREIVLHRDVKPHNVVLDSDFRAKLVDFGLAKEIGEVSLTHSAPNILMENISRETVMEKYYTTCPAGTIGYLAPEVIQTGKVTRKADVYSFGVLALGIACGKKPLDRSLDERYRSLVECVWDLYTEQRIEDAADERLGKNFNVEQMRRLILVGLWCSLPDPNVRPSMKQVLNTLEGENLSHDFLNRPRFEESLRHLMPFFHPDNPKNLS